MFDPIESGRYLYLRTNGILICIESCRLLEPQSYLRLIILTLGVHFELWDGGIGIDGQRGQSGPGVGGNRLNADLSVLIRAQPHGRARGLRKQNRVVSRLPPIGSE